MHVWKFLLEKLVCGEFTPLFYTQDLIFAGIYALFFFKDLIFIFQISVVFAILGLLAGVAIYMDPEVGFLHPLEQMRFEQPNMGTCVTSKYVCLDL